MRNRILAVGCAAIVLSASAASAGTTYYVSNSGSDSGFGTISDPWKTIGHVNNQTFSAGDTILFEADGVWMEQLVISDSGNSDVSGGPITVGMYGSGERPIIGYDEDVSGSFSWTRHESTDAWYISYSTRVHLMCEWVGYAEQHSAAGYARIYARTSSPSQVAAEEGSWFWSVGSSRLYVHLFDDADPNTSTHGLWVNTTGDDSSDGAVDVNGQSYIVVQDLHVVCNGSGINTDEADHVVVKDCRISGNRSGVAARKDTVAPEFLTIRDSDIRYNGNGTKIVGASNVTVFGNYVSETHQRHYSTDDGEGISFQDCDDYEVYENELTEIASAAITSYAGIGEVTNVSIHHNYLYGYCDKGINLPPRYFVWVVGVSVGSLKSSLPAVR